MTSSSFHERLVAALPRNRPVVVVAASCWSGCAVGLGSGSRLLHVVGAEMALAIVLVIVAAAARGPARLRLWAWVAWGALVVGTVSGAAASARIAAAASAPVDPGRQTVAARILSDPRQESFGTFMLVAASGPALPGEVTLLVDVGADLPNGGTWSAGDLLRIDGWVTDRPGRSRGDRYRAVIEPESLELVEFASGPFFGPGNRLRRLFLDRLGVERSDASALVAGFLVGDTDGLSDVRLDELRRAGLTHFVAVSGSNVAVFLGAWWLVVGPLGLDPRLRASLGLAALGVFVVATRWEPSVVRAASMAGTVLAGRAVGLPVDPWRALGLAVTLLLVLSAELAVDVGFQLSVAATCGVLVAMRMAPSRQPRWVWAALTVTVGAQTAVLPLLLVHFGTVPLLSPLANLVAAPLVTVATVLGGIGSITGVEPLLHLAFGTADGVLTVASVASGWPQLSASGILVVAGVVALFAGLRRLRPVVAVAVGAALIGWAMPPPAPSEPVLVFLDVGQGDAILVRDPPDRVMLIDGGPDPVVLDAALRRHGVDSLDVVVVTHGDSDHVGGLQGVLDRHRVGEVWYPADQHNGDLLDALLAAASARGVPTTAVGAGLVADLGDIHLTVIGPRRRYAADNDGSVVLTVSAGGVEALLTGDVEAVAQAELPEMRPDVLQVPHHGSATTDLEWLRETVGPLAVISVGDNQHGHPRPEVVDTLATAGAEVMTTIGVGDIVVPLCPCPAPP